MSGMDELLNELLGVRPSAASAPRMYDASDVSALDELFANHDRHRREDLALRATAPPLGPAANGDASPKRTPAEPAASPSPTRDDTGESRSAHTRTTPQSPKLRKPRPLSCGVQAKPLAASVSPVKPDDAPSNERDDGDDLWATTSIAALRNSKEERAAKAAKGKSPASKAKSASPVAHQPRKRALAAAQRHASDDDDDDDVEERPRGAAVARARLQSDDQTIDGSAASAASAAPRKAARLLNLEDESESVRPFFVGVATSQERQPLVFRPGGEHEERVVHEWAARYLRTYQMRGVEWMLRLIHERRGGILNDDMGLGKTVQVLCTLLAHFSKTGVKEDDALARKRARHRGRLDGGQVKTDETDDGRPWTVAVVCPKAVLSNWQREMEVWGFFDFEVLNAFACTDRPRVIQSCRPHARAGQFGGRNRPEILLMTAGMLRKYSDELSAVTFGVFFFDEVHMYRCASKLTGRAAVALQAVVKIGLTGTLVQNDMAELHTIVSLVCPKFMRLGAFNEYYATPINLARSNTASDPVIAEGKARAKELTQLLAPVVLRRCKQNVLRDELPDKQEHVVFCPLTALQKQVYCNVLNGADAQLLIRRLEPCDCGRERAKRGWCCHKTAEGAPLWSAYHSADGGECQRCPGCLFLPLISKLILCGTHLDLLKAQADSPDRVRVREFAEMAFGADSDAIGGTALNERFLDKSDDKLCGKLSVLGKLLAVWTRNAAKNNKILIFSHYVRVLDVIESYLKRAHALTPVRFQGNMSTAQREKAIDEFSTQPDVPIMLVSTKAGGVGINLTAANIVVLFDSSWNPMHEAQAQDRAFRLGQRRDVDVFRLISTGTIEEKMYCRQLYKIHVGNVSTLNADEPRMFNGVAKDRRRKGELFGAENLFAFEPDRGFMSALKETMGWKSPFKPRSAEGLEAEKGLVIEDIGSIDALNNQVAAAPRGAKSRAGGKRARGAGGAGHGAGGDSDDDDEDLFDTLLDLGADAEEQEERERMSQASQSQGRRQRRRPRSESSDEEDEMDDDKRDTNDVIAATTMNVNSKDLIKGGG